MTKRYTPGTTTARYNRPPDNVLDNAACGEADAWLFDPITNDEREHTESGRTEKFDMDRVRLAKRICLDECPVRMACLLFALSDGHVWGVWGGEYFSHGNQYHNRKKVDYNGQTNDLRV